MRATLATILVLGLAACGGSGDGGVDADPGQPDAMTAGVLVRR
jgi:hypothetical protein